MSNPSRPKDSLDLHLRRLAHDRESALGELRLDPTTGELVLARPDEPARTDGVVIDQIAEDGFFGAPRVVVHDSAVAGLREGERRELGASAIDEMSVIDVEHVEAPARPGWERVPCIAVGVVAGALEGARATVEELAASRAGAGAALALVVEAGARGGAAVLVRAGRAYRCELLIAPSRAELFSRTRGLLESDALASRRVGIVGLGSGGSPIAVDLARAGVGRFVLVDPDVLEPANLSRHVCGLRDLGRAKVHAVRDVILERNPYADVDARVMDIDADLAASRETLEGCDLLIGATDGTRSRANVNRIALDLGIPALFGRALTRASGGDVLRVRPGVGPCLACVFGQGGFRALDEEVSGRRQVDRDAPGYVPEGARDAMIQPGLATDIAPISNMMTRLALLELSRGTSAEIASLDEDLAADLYLWANRRDAVYRGWAPMGFGTSGLSVLRWFGVRAARNPSCPECGDHRITAGIPPVLLEAPPPEWPAS